MALALEVGPCHPSPSRRDLWTPLPRRGRAPGLGPAPRSGGALIRIPPTSCVPMATAPLPAAFKGDCTYRDTHPPNRAASCGFISPSISAAGPRWASSRAEVSAPPRRPAPGLAPGIPAPGPRSLPRSRVPAPRRVPEPGRPVTPAARGPPGRALFRALAPLARAALPGRQAILGRAARAAAAPGLPGRVRAWDRGHAGAGLPSSPHRPTFLPFHAQLPSPFLARPRSFPRPGPFSDASSLTVSRACGHDAPVSGAQHAGAQADPQPRGWGGGAWRRPAPPPPGAAPPPSGWPRGYREGRRARRSAADIPPHGFPGGSPPAAARQLPPASHPPRGALDPPRPTSAQGGPGGGSPRAPRCPAQPSG
ncbi:unnamed protein product [Rangifer tarandus platyrhynchus]|uniref:Basic proline-rich protein-like n=1 Tax=Rangifer tarandus platyrhynchus TaxID=3082113 RepID=A0ABN8YRQ9_RANTA|nr:unnamed protein product [Rangifer tarandus platyrhynchus]